MVRRLGTRDSSEHLARARSDWDGTVGTAVALGTTDRVAPMVAHAKTRVARARSRVQPRNVEDMVLPHQGCACFRTRERVFAVGSSLIVDQTPRLRWVIARLPRVK